MSATPSAYSVRRSSPLSVTPGAVCIGCFWLALNPMALFGPFLLSAALHELAHWAVLRAFGCRVTSLRITALGCVMQTPPLPYPVECRCALAGPAMNLLLFFLSLHRHAPLALVNLILAGFNLLPLWPLDGGRFLRALLWSRSDPVTAQRRELWVTLLTLSALWLGTLWLTTVLHTGLTPAALTAALTLRAGQEKLVAKKRA